MSGSSIEANRTIYRLASAQHGVVGRRQLLDLGVTSDQVHRRSRSGLLIAVHRGVYRAGHAPLTQQARHMAAALVAGPDAVLSHDSAAVAWGLLDRPVRGPGLVHVSRSGSARQAAPGVKIHVPNSLTRDEIDHIGAIPLTSVSRTLVDLAGSVGRRVLGDAYSAARRLRLLNRRELEDLLGNAPNRRGAGRLRRLHERFENVAGPSVSELQDRLLDAILRSDLPDPDVEVPIGRYVVDMLWSEQGLVCEADGRKWHEDRFDADRERDAELMAMGYRTVRVTYAMLDDSESAVLDRIRRALATGAESPPHPPIGCPAAPTPRSAARGPLS